VRYELDPLLRLGLSLLELVNDDAFEEVAWIISGSRLQCRKRLFLNGVRLHAAPKPTKQTITAAENAASHAAETAKRDNEAEQDPEKKTHDAESEDERAETHRRRVARGDEHVLEYALMRHGELSSCPDIQTT